MTQGEITLVIVGSLLIIRAIVYQVEGHNEAARALATFGVGLLAAWALLLMGVVLLEHLSIGWH